MTRLEAIGHNRVVPVRRRLAHAALLLGLLSWVGGLTAGLVHAIEVAHVRCVEHGELVELAGSTDGAADVVQVRAPPAHDDHDHGCLLSQTVEEHAVHPQAVGAPTPAVLPEAVARAPAWGPRAPPLRFDPKTSPPTS